jgi:hypothetical protein
MYPWGLCCIVSRWLCQHVGHFVLLIGDDEGDGHNSIHQVYLHPIMVILLMAVLQEVKEKIGKLSNYG